MSFMNVAMFTVHIDIMKDWKQDLLCLSNWDWRDTIIMYVQWP